MRAERVGRAVAENRGCGAAGPVLVDAAEDVEHGVDADMGEVYEDTEAVHLFDHCAAGGADASPERSRFGDTPVDVFNNGSIGVGIVAVVRQSCVADAEGVVGA